MKIPLNKRGKEAEGFRGLSREPARSDANKPTPKAQGPLPPLLRGNHSFSCAVAPPVVPWTTGRKIPRSKGRKRRERPGVSRSSPAHPRGHIQLAFPHGLAVSLQSESIFMFLD